MKRIEKEKSKLETRIIIHKNWFSKRPSRLCKPKVILDEWRLDKILKMKMKKKMESKKKKNRKHIILDWKKMTILFYQNITRLSFKKKWRLKIVRKKDIFQMCPNKLFRILVSKIKTTPWFFLFSPKTLINIFSTNSKKKERDKLMLIKTLFRYQHQMESLHLNLPVLNLK